MNQPEKNVVNVDSVVKFIGIVSAVVAAVVAVYIHFLSMITKVEDRVTDLEKQHIKDEKYQEYADKNRIDIEIIQTDLKSVNDTLTEIIRSMRSREERGGRREKYSEDY